MVQKMINAHPAMNFQEAYEHAQTLWIRVRAGSAGKRDFIFSSRGDLLIAMGRSYKSGSSHTIAAALVHFGFLTKTEEGGYRLSSEGRDLLSLNQTSDRWQQTAKELAIKPELYNYLYKEYGAKLPSNISAQLIGRYGDRNINRANVESVIKDYRKSLSFAGYPEESSEREPFTTSSNHLEDLQEVPLDGQTLSISKKFLLEAYEKTLQEKLKRVKQALQDWAE
jgi:hypothetical protein